MKHTPLGETLEGALCHALSQLYYRLPDTETWPLYFGGVETSNDPTRSDAWDSALGSMRALPWPDDPCLLATACYFTASESEWSKPTYDLTIWIHGLDLEQGTRTWWPGTQERELITIADVGGPPEPDFILGMMQVGRIDLTVPGPAGVVYTEEIRRYFETARVRRAQDPNLPAVTERYFEETEEENDARRRTTFAPGRSLWIAGSPDDEAMGKEFESVGARFLRGLGWAGSQFRSIIMPCGYLARGTLRRGVGDKSMRRRTTGKPVLAHISADRLYHEWKETDQSHVVPHFRRGHVRNLWAAAGIDRHTLPRDPEKRLCLSLEKHVRRVYVSPAWVGEKTGSTDRFEWEIQTGSTALDLLYASLRGKS